jgi:signal transduction histidine kinase
MPEGGTLTISSAVSRRSTRPAQVSVEFKDTGQGMPEEQCRRAFTSVLTTTKTKGTGLGLAIVGRVVETHHGEVKIKSRPGHGTTVSVFLPARSQ